MTERQTKAWYKKWWGILIAILIWPYFLIWFVWAKTKWSKKLRIGATIPLVIVCILLFIMELGMLSPQKPSTKNTSDISSTQSKKTNSTTNLSQLNAQAAAILTTATTDVQQTMNAGQTDGAQSNAETLNPPSAFQQWRNQYLKTKNPTILNAYTNASALYIKAHEPIPSALKAWKTDNNNAFGDIGYWQLMEVTVLVDNEGGSTSSSVQKDQSVLAEDYQAYKTDLTKALADISKLSGKTVAPIAAVDIVPKAQQPTESLATLNAQAVALFNPVLSDFEQQMAQGEADAAQSDAGDVSSAFHSWETAEQDKQNVANNNEQVKAYNSADNAYFNAHQNAPSAISNWDTDAGNIPGDITQWANAEDMVAGDEVMTGSVSSSDQQAANSALQQYKSDLAKAQADVSQL